MTRTTARLKDDDDDDDDDDGNKRSDGETAEASIDFAPPPCKADVQRQQHKASPQRVMTLRIRRRTTWTKPPRNSGLRISEWRHRAKYTLLVEWKTNIVGS